MTSLISVFILTAILYGPAGEVQQAETQGAHRSAEACEINRALIIATPPVGLPPQVGLVCVEVQIKVTPV
jgi:hypothetical protein